LHEFGECAMGVHARYVAILFMLYLVLSITVTGPSGTFNLQTSLSFNGGQRGSVKEMQGRGVDCEECLKGKLVGDFC